MKKVSDNGVFQYKSPVLFKDKDNKKWFIRYATKYPGEDKFKEVKEYGRLYADKSLNLIKNLRQRTIEFNDVIDALSKDLEDGIDKNRASTVQNYIDEVSSRKHYDTCINQYYVNKGLVNPIPKKQKTAEVTKIFQKNQFRPFLERKGLLKNISLISKSDIREFFDFYDGSNPDPKKRWSNTSFNNKKGLLGSFFAYLVDEEIIEHNPVAKIKYKASESTQRFGVYSQREREIVFEYLEEHNLFMATVTKLIYHAYIRETELTRLRCRDFRMNDREIVIEPDIAKGQKDGLVRFVVMNKQLTEAIKTYLSMHPHKPDDYIFGKLFKPSPYQLGYSWQQVYTRALDKIKQQHPTLFKTPGLTLYAWKHSGVTDFIRNNAGKFTSMQLLEFVKSQCRHEKFEMTQRYLKQLRININTVDEFKFE